jgi:citronellol/citronellal dehydrogenase
MTLKDKVLFITGASRGIGLAIALKAAKDGARIVIAAKTATANDKLPGTIYSAAEEIRAAGGEALAVQCDVRDEEQIKAAIAKAVKVFGGIDIVVNNAGAIQLTNTEQTDMKRFDLMQGVNARAVYMTVKHALPHLRKSTNAHVLNLSPPLNLDSDWFAPHLAYTLSKYGMSLCTLGLAAEFKGAGIAVNSLWPETAIDTSAIRNLLGGEESASASRTPDIVADSAYWIFTQPARECTGNFFIDSAVMAKAGVSDLSKYSVVPGSTLLPDFFLGKPPKFLPKVKAMEPAATAVTVKETVAAPSDSAPAPELIAAPAPETVLATAAPAYKAFTIDIVDGVATLTLTNPGKSNALGEEFWKELPRAIKDLAVQDVCALVICGDGEHFSSGIDLAMFSGPTMAPALADLSSPEAKNNLSLVIWRMQDAITAVEKAPFPVIAAVHGACLGAALDLVAACDFRYGSKSASFAIEEINLGIMADLGSLQRLPLIMPAGLVRELAFTGKRLDSTRALSSGLLNAVFDDRATVIAEAQKTAKIIAGKVSVAVNATKTSLNYGLDHGVFEGLQLTAKLQTRVIDPPAILSKIKKLKKA